MADDEKLTAKQVVTHYEKATSAEDIDDALTDLLTYSQTASDEDLKRVVNRIALAHELDNKKWSEAISAGRDVHSQQLSKDKQEILSNLFVERNKEIADIRQNVSTAFDSFVDNIKDNPNADTQELENALATINFIPLNDDEKTTESDEYNLRILTPILVGMMERKGKNDKDVFLISTRLSNVIKRIQEKVAVSMDVDEQTQLNRTAEKLEGLATILKNTTVITDPALKRLDESLGVQRGNVSVLKGMLVKNGKSYKAEDQPYANIIRLLEDAHQKMDSGFVKSRAFFDPNLLIKNGNPIESARLNLFKIKIEIEALKEEASEALGLDALNKMQYGELLEKLEEQAKVLETQIDDIVKANPEMSEKLKDPERLSGLKNRLARFEKVFSPEGKFFSAQAKKEIEDIEAVLDTTIATTEPKIANAYFDLSERESIDFRESIVEEAPLSIADKFRNTVNNVMDSVRQGWQNLLGAVGLGGKEVGVSKQAPVVAQPVSSGDDISRLSVASVTTGTEHARPANIATAISAVAVPIPTSKSSTLPIAHPVTELAHHQRTHASPVSLKDEFHGREHSNEEMSVFLENMRDKNFVESISTNAAKRYDQTKNPSSNETALNVDEDVPGEHP